MIKMPKVTAMMIVRNESHRYLFRCLKALEVYTDEIIVLDDASTDDTPEICLSFPKVKLYREEKSTFFIDEGKLRQKLWNYTIANNPQWILAIDADEFLDEISAKELNTLINLRYFNAISFRLFDCWINENQFRLDGLWNPWLRGFSIYMIKYQPQLKASWPSLTYHCGRIPLEYRMLPHYESDIRIKHLGWSNPHSLKEKYNRAIAQDPTNKYFSKSHYESILIPLKDIVLQNWNEHYKY